MTENKTKPTSEDVSRFLDAVPDEVRRADAKAVGAMMHQVTGEAPYMYGSSIVGFGSYHYRYDSGREGDAPLAAFSPRARELVVYLDCDGAHSKELLGNLGPHKIGKSCLYIKRLSDVDENVLRKLIVEAIDTTRARYPS
jgi:Domain of unknown function (DU1801)